MKNLGNVDVDMAALPSTLIFREIGGKDRESAAKTGQTGNPVKPTLHAVTSSVSGNTCKKREKQRGRFLFPPKGGKEEGVCENDNLISDRCRGNFSQ